MIRRAVIATALLGVLAGASAAFADSTPAGAPTHEICLVTSNDPHHHTTDDFCINWPGAARG
jgi:hypothetical protein